VGTNRELEDILMSRDRSFITAITKVTVSTELDNVFSFFLFSKGTLLAKVFCILTQRLFLFYLFCR
jgi:hypothetical protein